MIFRYPAVLAVIPVFLFYFFLFRKERGGFIFPSVRIFEKRRGTLRTFFVKNTVYLRVACLILLVLSLARPQMNKANEIKKEGIAVVLAIDCSSTMLAEDIQLSFQELAEIGKGGKTSNIMNRIEAVKFVAGDFISARPDDLVGIVAFAAQAYIACPPTFDHEWLKNTLERIQVGMIKDGTAIGSGILSGINSLRDVQAKSKVIILLTDGINNFGNVPPIVAAKAARAMGIKIYTVGILSGTSGFSKTRDGSGKKIYRKFTAPVDETELREISSITGGKYFAVSDMTSLKTSYEEINKLERTAIEQKSFETYVDVFPTFLFPALILLFLEILLSNTYLRRIP